MKWLSYTVYWSDPIKVGITFKPMPSLTWRELREVMNELQQIHDEIAEVMMDREDL